jgi:dTDP-4-amino-4,6-dideoxygalactose transaminase
LHLACLALGIGPGDEVIVPSLTFVATSNAVLYTGAEVRFAEVAGAHDLNIDPVDIERQITPRTKAVMVVHYAGYPCQMDAIQEIARRRNLAVIEDAAHAPGARLNGRALGAWGDVGCFSFFSNKNLATGEGGMLTTDRNELADKLRMLRSHGMTSLTWDRHKGHAYSYDVVGLGYNYRMDELRAALGVAQLQKLALNNARRGQLTRAYWEALDGWLEMPFQQLAAEPGVEPVYHIFPALLPPGVDRISFIDRLRSQGIQTSIHYPPIHTFSYYKERYPNLSLPRTEALAAREITLPLYPTMSPADLEAVATAVRHALQ